LKILIATSAFAPTLGGLQTVTEEIAIAMQRKGYLVKVLCNRVPLNLQRKECYNSLDIERIWFPGLFWPGKNLRLWAILLFGIISFPISLFSLFRLLQEFKPNIINIHHPQTMVPFFILVKAFTKKAKIVTSLHGYDVECFVGNNNYYDQGPKVNLKGFNQFFIKKWLLQSDLIIANSAYIAGIANKLVPEFPLSQLKVFHNAIDPQRFKNRVSLQKPLAIPFIFAFGRFDYQKGFDLLLLAFAKILNQLPHHLVIAGSGPEEGNYKGLVEKYGMQGRVHFTGRAQPKEVVAYLQAAAFVVVPSRHGEAFGITVLEALAAGKAVVATNVGGIPEFARFRYCFICPPKSEDIAKQMLACANTDLDKDILIKQQELVWQKFNWPIYITKYENALLSL